MDGSLTDNTTPDKNRPGINCNEITLHYSEGGGRFSFIPKTLHFFFGGGKDSQFILSPVDWVLFF